MNKWIIAAGVLLIIIGLLWEFISKLPLGHLPGDIVIERPNFKFYFPLATGILISLIISFILYLIRKF